MNDAKAVWERYVRAWNAASSAERSQIFRECLAQDCVYTDPLQQTSGWAELDGYMTEFQRQLPGARFVTEYFLAHHGRSIARWKMVSADGVTIGSGISYGEYDTQQRLRTMSGFFETPAGQTPS